MDWQVELIIAMRALIAAVLGAIIGIDRYYHGREAGVRTYSAVALGACAFSAISQHLPGADPSRIASNVVTGVGFLGAGVILRHSGRTTGLTTAATVWATSAVGMAVGLGMYLLGIVLAALVSAVLLVHHLPGWKTKSPTDEPTS